MVTYNKLVRQNRSTTKEKVPIHMTYSESTGKQESVWGRGLEPSCQSKMGQREVT